MKNAGKIIGIIGLALGGFLLFNSFKGAETVPDGNTPGDDTGNTDPGYDETDYTSQCTSPRINCRYIIDKFQMSSMYPNMLELVMNLPGNLKPGNTIKIDCVSLPPDWAEAVNVKTNVQEVRTENGKDVVLTTWGYSASVATKLLAYLNFRKQGANGVKLVSFTSPGGGGIIVTTPDLPIIAIAPNFNPVTGQVIAGQSFITVTDRNYKLNTVQPGSFVKLDQTINPAYNNQTVKVLNIGERNPANSSRTLIVEMQYQGENNNGGQLLIV